MGVRVTQVSHVINPLHAYYSEDHLQHVIGQMVLRGPPIIRAFFDGEAWHAYEGTHRLRAAKALGIAPTISPIPWWRSPASLTRARYALRRNAHTFSAITVLHPVPLPIPHVR